MTSHRSIALTAIAAWLGFAAIAVAVAQGWTQNLDEALLLALRHGPTGLTGPMRALTHLGDGWFRPLVILAGCAALIRLGRRGDALFLPACAFPAGLITEAAKAVFARPRPSVVEHLTAADGYSFPSGHAFAGTTLYLALALAFAPLIPPRYQTLTVALALLLGALIAFTRIWLGVHYPSDIAAGYLAAIGWVLSCRLLVRDKS